jgi:hypothetical protein
MASTIIAGMPRGFLGGFLNNIVEEVLMYGI